jgi:hypothetical protein
MTQEQFDTLKEKQAELIKRDRLVLIRYLIHSAAIIHAIDELEDSPLRWISNRVKQSFKRFDRDFQTDNKDHLYNIFNLTTDDTENRGDAYLNTFNAVMELGNVIAELPLHTHPDIIELIKAYKADKVEVISELEVRKLNIDEGAE